jgi:hypothetical protein
MQKLQNGSTMKNQGNMTPSKVHNFSKLNLKDVEVIEMSDKEFKSLTFKMINDLKED